MMALLFFQGGLLHSQNDSPVLAFREERINDAGPTGGSLEGEKDQVECSIIKVRELCYKFAC